MIEFFIAIAILGIFYLVGNYIIEPITEKIDKSTHSIGDKMADAIHHRDKIAEQTNQTNKRTRL